MSNHIICTCPLAVLSYKITQSSALVAGLFMGGVLIDTDHLIEFWYDNGLSLNIHKFFAYANKGVNSRFFIIFHSYELILILFVISRICRFSFLLNGIIIGLVAHLLLDYINIVRRFDYKRYSFVIFSFMFRLLLGFDRMGIDNIIRHPQKA